MSEIRHLHVVVERDDDGALFAEIPELPGCIASGSTIEELEEALEEAIGLYLDLYASKGGLW